MEGFFEDAKNFNVKYTQKHLFYSLMNGTDYEKQYPVKPHWHYYVEVLYILEGKGEIVLNGNCYTVIEDDVVFAMPRDVHAVNLIGDEDFNYIVLKFDPDLLFDSSEKSFILKNIIPILEPFDPSLKVLGPNVHSPSLKEEMTLVMELFQNEPYAYELLARANIIKLFYDYLTFLATHDVRLLDDGKQHKDVAYILPAYEFIHEHFKEDITAKDVAEHCHLSYSYFSRMFKRTSGISYTKYLNFMRITEAEKLLLQNDATVTQVSFSVGFSDTSYFIKQFRGFKKMTPSEFIKKKRYDSEKSQRRSKTLT